MANYSLLTKSYLWEGHCHFGCTDTISADQILALSPQLTPNQIGRAATTGFVVSHGDVCAMIAHTKALGGPLLAAGVAKGKGAAKRKRS